MKSWLAEMLLTGLLMLGAPNVSACTCIIPEVRQALNRADAVFIGKVKEIIEAKKSATTSSSSEIRFYTIKFEVEKNWKGAPLAEYSVLSAQGDGCFAYHRIKTGEEYLVFADPVFHDGERMIGESVITNCGRTRFRAKAASDIRALNSLSSPISIIPGQKARLELLDWYKSARNLIARTPAERANSRP